MHVYQELSTSREFESAFPLLSTVLLSRLLSVFLCTMLLPRIFVYRGAVLLRCIFRILSRFWTYILWPLADSHWYFSPWIVAMTLRVCFAARNSRYQMPCHVPVACVASLSVVLAWGGKPGELRVGGAYEFAVLDGDGDARADQRGLDMRLHTPSLATPSSPPTPIPRAIHTGMSSLPSASCL